MIIKKIASEKIKGSKNPNDSSNTTEQQRKERSPFSIEFYKRKNPGITDEQAEQMKRNFLDTKMKGKITNCNIEFYTNKGYSEEEANQMLKERQSTFSLKKCIIKYGEVEGIKIFAARQTKWLKSLSGNKKLKSGFSGISQELFNELLKYYTDDEKKFVYYASHNDEVYLVNDKKTFYKYDYADNKRMKIIEYNGDIYHANPNRFISTDCPTPFDKNLTAQEIWDNDKNKLMIANNNKYELLVVWDSEYRKDKIGTIDRCRKFIFGE